MKFGSRIRFSSRCGDRKSPGFFITIIFRGVARVSAVLREKNYIKRMKDENCKLRAEGGKISLNVNIFFGGTRELKRRLR